MSYCLKKKSLLFLALGHGNIASAVPVFVHFFYNMYIKKANNINNNKISLILSIQGEYKNVEAFLDIPT